MKSSTSSSTLRIPLLIKDQNSFPNVGTRRLISCQKTRKIFKKLFSKLSLSTNSTKSKSKWMFSTISFLIFTFFLFVLMCILIYANYVYSSSNEQFSRPSWRESIRFETISPGEIYDSCCDPGVDYLHTDNDKGHFKILQNTGNAKKFKQMTFRFNRMFKLK